MNVYLIVLFLHVIGAVSLFTATGIVFVCVTQLRQAQTVAQARLWLRLPNVAGRLIPLLEIIMLASGAYLIVTAWWSMLPAWAVVAFGTLAFLLPFGLVTIGRWVQGIFDTVQGLPDGPLSEAVWAEVQRPMMWMSHCVFVALLIGILFLMTIQPDLVGSLIAIGVTILLGITAGLPFQRARRSQTAGKGSTGSAFVQEGHHE